MKHYPCRLWWLPLILSVVTAALNPYVGIFASVHCLTLFAMLIGCIITASGRNVKSDNSQSLVSFLQRTSLTIARIIVPMIVSIFAIVSIVITETFWALFYGLLGEDARFAFPWTSYPIACTQTVSIILNIAALLLFVSSVVMYIVWFVSRNRSGQNNAE